MGPSPSNSELLPHGEYLHEGRLKIVIAGLDKNVRAHAMEAANQRLSDKLGENGFKGFLNKIWHGGFAREHYLLKYAKEAKADIVESDNLFENEGLSAEEYKVATTLRFAHEYDGLVHEEVGEHRHVVDRNEDGSVDVEGYELKHHLFDLVSQYAAGEFDGPTPDDTERNFNEEASRLITELIERGVISKDHVGEARVRLDNLYQVSQNVRVMVDHGVGLDEIAHNTDIVLGEAKVGARTEADTTRAERMVEKLSGKAWINEGTVIPAVTIAMSTANFAAKAGASAAVAAVAGIAVPGALAGVWAGMRESARSKRELTELKRGIETGKIENPESSIMRSAESLIDQLGVLYDDNGELRISDEDSMYGVLATIAECDSRIYLTNVSEPLISDASEMDRYDLYVALAKAKSDVADFIQMSSDSQLRQLGYDDVAIAELRQSDDLVDAILAPYIDAEDGVLSKEITSNARLERKAHLKRVGLAALQGSALGIFAGGVSQELYSLMNDEIQGVVEGRLNANSDARQTFYQNFMGRGEGSHEAFADLTNSNRTESIGSRVNIQLPEGFSFVREGDVATVTGLDGFRVENLSLTEDGHFTPAAEQALASKGLNLIRFEDISPVNVEKETVVSAREFLDNHQDNVTKVTRDFWYTNAIEGRADGAELGISQVRVDADGNYVVDLSGMGEKSFTSNGQEVDWRQAASEGKLSLVLSASSGSQSEAIMLDIDPSGPVVVDKDSFAASMFSQHDGEAAIKGKFLEVVEVAGQDEDGVTHIRPLATAVGEGADVFQDKLQVVENVQSTLYSAEYTAPEGNASQVAIPYVLPVSMTGWQPSLGRRKESGQPLTTENSRTEPYDNEAYKSMPNGFDNENYFGTEFDNFEDDDFDNEARAEAEAKVETKTPEANHQSVNVPELVVELPPDKFQPAENFRQQWEFEMSPTLEENPDAQLDINEELDRYIADQVIRHGREYANNIESQNNTIGLSELITSDTEAIVCAKIEVSDSGIPIRDIVSAYARQGEEAVSKSVFLIDIAWSADVSSDEDAAALFSRVNSEFVRARAEFPSLKVTAYARDWHERGSMTENEHAKERYDVAAFAAEAAISAGKQNSLGDLLIVSNDANATSIPADYLGSYIKEFEANPETDVFTGAYVRQGAATPDYPGYDVVMSFLSNLEVEHQQDNPAMTGYVIQNGSNMAFRMSAYAAVGGCAGEAVRADDEICQRVVNARQGSIGGRPVVQHVADAQVTATLETDESLEQYRRGNWVAEPVYAGEQNGAMINAEDPQSDLSGIVDRIELNVNSYIANIPSKPEIVEDALVKTFGPISGSKAAFVMRWSRDYTKAQFNLTNIGRQMLLQKLTNPNTEEPAELPTVESVANGGVEIENSEITPSVPSVKPKIGDILVSSSGMRLKIDGTDGRGMTWFKSLMPDNITPYPTQPQIRVNERKLSDMLVSGEYKVLR
jgi:hypothetical protein